MTLMTSLLSQIVSDVKDDIEALFLFGAIGVGTTAAVAGDTELEEEILRKGIANFDKSVGDAVTASLEILTIEANNNAVSELGWLDTDISVVDNCDVVTGWTDSADMTISVNSTEFKENDLSLNLTKDAGGAAEATTAKTIASPIDFTSKEVGIWIFIVDAAALTKMAVTNGFGLRFGSDSGNYFEWFKDRADFSVGWNLIKDLTTGNADNTVGAPVTTALDFVRVALTATSAAITWSAGDFIMDDIKVSSGTLFYRDNLTAINKIDSIQLFLDTTITITVIET